MMKSQDPVLSDRGTGVCCFSRRTVIRAAHPTRVQHQQPTRLRLSASLVLAITLHTN